MGKYIDNYETFESYSLNLEEQRKLAGAIATIDELIEDHIKKLELLKDHKKGLMQRLLPKSIQRNTF